MCLTIPTQHQKIHQKIPKIFMNHLSRTTSVTALFYHFKDENLECFHQIDKNVCLKQG